MMPPSNAIDVMIATTFPYAAVPIRMKATNWKVMVEMFVNHDAKLSIHLSINEMSDTQAVSAGQGQVSVCLSESSRVQKMQLDPATTKLQWFLEITLWTFLLHLFQDDQERICCIGWVDEQFATNGGLHGQLWSYDHRGRNWCEPDVWMLLALLGHLSCPWTKYGK